MGIELPNAGNVFIPAVPEKLREVSPELFEWVQDFKRAVERGIQDQFSNNLNIATVINSGTSGTFTISSGGSIVVTSGIVITVTS